MKLLLLFVAVLTSFSSTSAQESYQSARLKEQIKKLDLAHARAIFNGDAAALANGN